MSTDTTIDPERLEGLVLAKGKHDSPDDGMCLMEAVAYIRGVPHTDHPECVSPYLGAIGRSLNDRLDDTNRQKLIPHIRLLPGTADDGLDDARRALARDHLVRVLTPKWLDKAGLTGHATTLRALPPIVDYETYRASRLAVQTARDACWQIRSARYDRIRSAVREALADRPDADAAAAAAAAADAADVAVEVAAADDRYWAIRDAVYAKARALYEERYADLIAESADDAVALYGRLINPVGAR